MKRTGSLSPSSSDSQATGRSATSDPFADQRGLAKAGGGRDEGQLSSRGETFIQSLNQARTENNFSPVRGNIKFRG